MTQAGGHLHVRSAPGRGTAIVVHLPRGPEVARPAPAPPPAPAPAVRGTETVLAVDDDPMVRDVTARALASGGYRVLVAAGGAEALELAARLDQPLHLVVTDVVMPGMEGRALAQELRRLRPGLRVLYVSGYPQDVISHHGVLDSGIELLLKPFSASALLSRVRTVLDGPG